MALGADAFEDNEPISGADFLETFAESRPLFQAALKDLDRSSAEASKPSKPEAAHSATIAPGADLSDPQTWSPPWIAAIDALTELIMPIVRLRVMAVAPPEPVAPETLRTTFETLHATINVALDRVAVAFEESRI